MAAISVIIPARDEAGSIETTIREVGEAFEDSPHDCEIIVVNDASRDGTAALARAAGACVISHPTTKGYGNALLTGIRHARFPWIAITDADGTYPVDRLPEFLDRALDEGLDMVVGARQWEHFTEPLGKRALRAAFGGLIRQVVGEPIPDINSGLRVIRRELLDRFAPVLSGGFSFTTSLTIIAFQTNHHVGYVPVGYFPRKGASHVRLGRDSLRALQIVVMTIILFNPIKLYLAQALAVLAASLGAGVLAIVFPALQAALSLACGGIWTANIILALGFLAVRHQLNLAGIDLPRRGYMPEVVAVDTESEFGED